MNSPVENVLQAALRGLNLRQRVTANNIANADTPGFKAQTVRFEDKLSQALGEAGDGVALQDAAAPEVDTVAGRVGKADQNSVDLDQQLLTMTDTNLQYNAVAQAVSARLALYRSIVTDGKA
ncbi:MAG: flagellar basal body rod protein FlgB [Chloroflexota bacterium]